MTISTAIYFLRIVFSFSPAKVSRWRIRLEGSRIHPKLFAHSVPRPLGSLTKSLLHTYLFQIKNFLAIWAHSSYSTICKKLEFLEFRFRKWMFNLNELIVLHCIALSSLSLACNAFISTGALLWGIGTRTGVHLDMTLYLRNLHHCKSVI